MDRMPTAMWTTTNSNYGVGTVGAAFDASGTKLLQSPRRPTGHDIGPSRPWPMMNEAALSPRVSARWISGAPPAAAQPADAALLASIRGGHSPRGLMPASQRDAAAGYAASLSEALTTATPSGKRIAFGGLYAASDSYGAYDGRAIRPPEASGWLERRTAGAAAVRALKGDAAEVAAPPPSVPRAAPVVADQGSEGD